MKLKLDGKLAIADVNYVGEKVIIEVTGFGDEKPVSLELTAGQAAELIKQLANALTAIID